MGGLLGPLGSILRALGAVLGRSCLPFLPKHLGTYSAKKKKKSSNRRNLKIKVQKKKTRWTRGEEE